MTVGRGIEEDTKILIEAFFTFKLIVEECILVNYEVLKRKLYDLGMPGSLNSCTYHLGD